MILTCPHCATRYQADAAKFSPAGRTVRCAKCGHVWHQAPPADAAAPEPDLGVIEQPSSAEAETEEASASEFEAEQDDAAPRVHAPRPAASAGAGRPVPLQQRAAVIGGWAALVLVILVIGWSAVKYRQDVATLWPQSASLYSALGFDVNVRGIAFTGVTYKKGTEDGAPVLTVTGQLVNISSRELPVPQVRIALTDKDRRELFSWTYVPTVLTLKPGQVEPFRTRLASPPHGAAHLELRFVKAGE